MSQKLISIVVGVVLIISIGVLVYVNKKPAYLPLNNDPVINTPITSNTNTTANIGEYDDEEEDDDEGGTASNNTTPTTTTTTTNPAPTNPTTGGITLAQVAQHNTRSSCWSVVNGNVYDLTSWIPNHPGGEQNILIMCGVDGSVVYNGQHGNSKKPANMLFGFKLGALAS